MYKNKEASYRYNTLINQRYEINKKIDDINKTVSRIGFCIGLLGVGGYFLYKKINNLSTEVKNLKEARK